MGFPDKMLISKSTKGRIGYADILNSGNCMATLRFIVVDVKDLKVRISPT
jgi:hypothetical protein